MRWLWIAILVGLAVTAHAQAPAPRSVPARELDCKLTDMGKDRIVTPRQLAKLSKGCKVGKGEVAVVVHEGWNGTHLVTVRAWFRRASVLAPEVRHSTTCGKGGEPIAARAYAVKVSGIKRLEVVPEKINMRCHPDDDDDEHKPGNP